MYLLLALIITGILGFPFLLYAYFAPIASATLQQPANVVLSGWEIFIGGIKLPWAPMLIAFLLLPATLAIAMFVHFRRVDRVKEYVCGEKVQYSFGSFFITSKKNAPFLSLEMVNPLAYAIGILFFIALLQPRVPETALG